MRKAREKLVAYMDHLVRLLTYTRNLSCDGDIMAFAKRSAKCVAGQRLRRNLRPCHDHARIEPPGERNTDSFSSLEVAGQVT